MQQQAMENAQDFYGQSLGRIKSQAQGYREQLEYRLVGLSENMPGNVIQAFAGSGNAGFDRTAGHGRFPFIWAWLIRAEPCGPALTKIRDSLRISEF